MSQNITLSTSLKQVIASQRGNTAGKKVITASQKQAAFTKLLSSLSGRKKIASSMREPLKTLRDYTSVARRAFYVDELPDGSMPVYDTDPETPAYVINTQGDSIVTLANVDSVVVPLFEITSLVEVKLTAIKERRFDIVKRVQTKAKTEMFRAEDKKLFAIMKLAGLNNTDNPVISKATADFTMPVLADAFGELGKFGHRVDKIFINALQFPVFLKAGKDYLDNETQRSLLQTGFLGSVYGAQIFQSMEVPAGDIFLVTEPEYFGVLPVRINLSILPADDNRTRVLGFSLMSYLGAFVSNPKGIQLIQIG